MGLSTIEVAISAISNGEMILIVDNEDRENEGDIFFAAQAATAQKVNFLINQCRGIVCAPMSAAYGRRLDLPPMVARNTDSMGTAFTVSVDLIDGITTGVSASERCATLRALADPFTKATDLSRPGHVFPLIARDGGVEVRPGHTEAAVDLAKLAGFAPVGVICEIIKDDGEMARRDDLEKFAEKHGLLVISIADLIEWKSKNAANKETQRWPSLVA